MEIKKNNKFPNSFLELNLISSPNFRKIIQIPNFLSQQDRDTLMNSVCQNQEVFNHRGKTDSKDSGSFNLALESIKNRSPKETEIFEACDSMYQKMITLLPTIFNTLEIEPFPVSHIPLSIVNGLNGHIGLPHTDESGGRFKISILYYFNKTPKVFQGGELQFFQNDSTLQGGHHEKPFATIEPQDNTLVAFPSDMYHGVTEVKLDSNNFEDGRFVMVGFLSNW